MANLKSFQVKFAIILLLFSQVVAYRSRKSVIRNLRTVPPAEFEPHHSKPPSSRRPIALSTEKRYHEDSTTVDGNVANMTWPPEQATIKKWQVGRVSRKQYEIINMLWRKTNIFPDVENASYSNRRSDVDSTTSITTTMNKKNIQHKKLIKHPQIFVQRSRKPASPSTPSFIEFYYLDETVEDIKPKNSESTKTNGQVKMPINNFGNFKSFSRSPSLFAFRVNDLGPVYNQGTRTPQIIVKSTLSDVLDVFSASDILNNLINKNKPIGYIKDLFYYDEIDTSTTKSPSFKSKNIQVPRAIKDTYPSNVKALVRAKSATVSDKTFISDKKASFNLDPVTASDRIKFFEIYDSNTYNPFMVKRLKAPTAKDDKENKAEGNDIDRNRRISEQIDFENYEAINRRKYPKNTNGIANLPDETAIQSSRSVIETAFSSTLKQKVEINTPKTIESHSNKYSTNFTSNVSNLVSWSNYPFAAVYAFEIYQVHCDAAVISPHWLVASGSCLSRHSRKVESDRRSAFVAYCGANWWNPERITYVKQTVVHPRYYSKNKSRRLLYNIGAIQVVSSMASACSNWAPISMMSHHFTAEPTGSMAAAVGWGLDRYDSRFTSQELPKIPLSVYESLVFSDSCPGNGGYRKAREKNEEGIKNVYCLTLPPYTGEDKDPVHGSLLLVGGNLIALFLQEERRVWGLQSAQYTGIWRLIPWIRKVAREPEEADFVF